MVDAGPHLDSDNVSLSFPARRVRPRRGLGETDWHRLDVHEMTMRIILVLCCYSSRPCCEMWFSSTSSCSFELLFHGQIITAAIQFCGLSYFKRFHFCILVSASHSSSRNPTHPPVSIAPRNFRSRKMWFLCQNSHFLVIFVGFLPITKSIMNRFRNGFHSRIALA